MVEVKKICIPNLKSIKAAENRVKFIEYLNENGIVPKPVTAYGSRIAKSYMGITWCKWIISLTDYYKKLTSGYDFIKYSNILHLEITQGGVEAYIEDTKLYKVNILVQPIEDSKWMDIKRICPGRLKSLSDLYEGKATTINSALINYKNGIFPMAKDMKFSCECNNNNQLCSHIAATIYGIGSRLDQEPEKIFTLRGVNPEEMLNMPLPVKKVKVSPSGGRLQKLKNGESEGHLNNPDFITGNFVRTLRLSQSETQAVFGARASLSAPELSKIERCGNSVIRIPTRKFIKLQQLCKELTEKN